MQVVTSSKPISHSDMSPQGDLPTWAMERFTYNDRIGDAQRTAEELAQTWSGIFAQE